MRYDLHIHTAASDGSDSPDSLARKVVGAGLELFSVTVHDSVDGALAMEGLIPAGVGYIRGVEFSCVSPGGKCHILGYGFDPEHPAFRAALGEGAQLRQEKLENRIVHLREKFGIRLTADALKSKSIVICHGCDACLREMDAYVWDLQSGNKERVKKENDLTAKIETLVKEYAGESKIVGFTEDETIILDLQEIA